MDYKVFSAQEARARILQLADEQHAHIVCENPSLYVRGSHHPPIPYTDFKAYLIHAMYKPKALLIVAPELLLSSFLELPIKGLSINYAPAETEFDTQTARVLVNAHDSPAMQMYRRFMDWSEATQFPVLFKHREHAEWWYNWARYEQRNVPAPLSIEGALRYNSYHQPGVIFENADIAIQKHTLHIPTTLIFISNEN